MTRTPTADPTARVPDGTPAHAAAGMRGASGAIFMALGSAAAFALSGPIAKSLMDAGWSPGAAVLLRIAGAAAVLLVPTLLTLRGRWRLLSGNAWLIAGYGIVAVVGAQVCFFNAIQHVSVGVALLIEYLAPVLIVAVVWLRTRRRPGVLTMVGAAASMLGMVLVLDLTGPTVVSPVGILWALGAAVSLAGYFVMSARVGDSLPPLVLAGGGLVIAAAVIAVLGMIGLLPMTFTDRPVGLLGWETNWLVPVLVLILVPTVFAYVIGIAATGRLGTRVASFVGLTEVIFAVVFAWLLLGELPSLVQLCGGIGIVVGVILVRSDRYRPSGRLPASGEPTRLGVQSA
ncbi:MAG: DMT family transporter [Microbacteriaceae bacterium]